MLLQVSSKNEVNLRQCHAVPSHSVALTPLRGKLFAQFASKPLAGPPLSVVKMITVLLIMPVFISASWTYGNQGKHVNGFFTHVTLCDISLNVMLHIYVFINIYV